jgi:hypothetical protein
MATTSPARTKKPTPDPPQDIELVGSIDTEDETFTAKIFGGEEFLFSTDVNGYLLLTATRGGDEFIALMDSLVLIPDTDGLKPKEIEAAREAEKERFHSVLAHQKHLTVERLARFVGELMEIAGNEEGESSSTD